MQKYTTAIEISGKWLKLVAVKPSLRGSGITHTITKTITTLKPEQISSEVAEVIKRLKIAPSPLIVSFPRNSVTMRNLHLPSLDPKEISGMIDLHMGRQVPYPREEIIGGYHILGTDEAGYSKIILAIAHKDSLKQLFNTLNRANLSPDKIELSSYGVFSWFIFNHKSQLNVGNIYILLDLDYNFADFMIVDKDNLYFSRSIAYGAEQLSGGEVDNLKFAAELKQSLVIFQSEEMNKKPAKIFISGAVEGTSGLTSLLEKELDIPVEVRRFATNASKDVSISALAGLAIDVQRKKIGFVLPEIQIRKSVKERSRDLIILGSTIMYLLLVFSGIFLTRMYNRTSYLKLLNKKYTEVQDEVTSLELMLKKVKIVRGRFNDQPIALNCIYHVNRFIPPNVVVKMLTYETGDKISLRGQAKEMADVFRFTDLLKDSEYFLDAQIKYLSLIHI